ncbi:MAG TPA: hypothetical protein VMV49_00980 [Candidatus Deferrimicrobium sp.]|nr:hypothetical protein [Candidatus Deferrimicrobium sp.]
MEQKITADLNEKKEVFFLYECPECHYVITCSIQVLNDESIEIRNLCENCEKSMNVLPDYVTPQRGIIYYRCYKCLQEVILHTLTQTDFLDPNSSN